MNKTIPLIVVLVGCALVVAGVVIILTKDNEEDSPINATVSETEFIELVNTLEDKDYAKVYDRMTDGLKGITSVEEIAYDWAVVRGTSDLIGIESIDRRDKSNHVTYEATYALEGKTIYISMGFELKEGKMDSLSLSNVKAEE